MLPYERLTNIDFRYGMPDHPPTSRREFLAAIGGAAVGLATSVDALRAAEHWPESCAYFDELVFRPEVKQKLAARVHRPHHLLWHATRNSWSRLDAAQRDALTALHWGVPRPSVERVQWGANAASAARWAVINGSGEDFLYFHRKMIAKTDQWLVAAGEKPIASWSNRDIIPPPAGGCRDEQVPPPWELSNLALTKRVEQIKSDAFYWNTMMWWEDQFTDLGVLSRTTLGELGSRLERTVHNQMHIRWSAQPIDPESEDPIPDPRPEPSIDKKWDDPIYDTLFDEYSSHVNPLFYRLHKWVDNRINDWAEAHQRAGHRIRGIDLDGVPWFEADGRRWVQVSAPWEGGFPIDLGRLPHHDEDQLIGEMEAVHRIMFGEPPEDEDELRMLAERPASEGPVLTLRDLAILF